MENARKQHIEDTLRTQGAEPMANPQELTRGIFSQMPQAEIDRLLMQLGIRHLAAGELCYRANEESRNLCLVLEGVLEISRKGSAGKIVVMNRVTQGEIIGEIGALTRGPRTADVRCVTKCVIGEMSLKSFEENLIDFPNFALFIMRSLAYRVSHLTSKLLEFATEDVPSRVLDALRKLPTIQAECGGRHEYPRERPTHAELARLVGTSREVVGRALQLLESAGEIEQDGRYVYLTR